MSEAKHVDVAIVGAGPTGMVLAAELVRYGLSVRIFDKDASAKDHSRALVLWPRAQDALDLMGIHPKWDGRTSPLRRLHYNVYGKSAGVVPMDQGEFAHPTPLLVGQNVTEEILETHLQSLGVSVERSTLVSDATFSDAGATVTIERADGTTEKVSASWVVGCDGTQSMIRTKANIAWEGHRLTGLMTPLGDFQAKWMLPRGDGDAYLKLTDEGWLMVMPLPGIWRVIVATPDTTAENEQPKTNPEEMSRLVSKALGGPVELTDSPWHTVIRFGNFRASTYRKGRLLLAGDAAHAIAPMSAQGMNVGVQDAFGLGWKLAYVHKGWAPDSLLDSYTLERRPVAATLNEKTSQAFKRASSVTEFRKRVLRRVFPIALSKEKIRRKIAAFYTGVNISYLDSPLNDAYNKRFPRPGEHVWDGLVVDWQEQATKRLYDVFRGKAWTAMLLTGATPTDADLKEKMRWLRNATSEYGTGLKRFVVVGGPTIPSSVVDRSTIFALDSWLKVHQKFDARRGALLLVRPDGYVALHRAGDEQDFQALKALLARNLTSAAAASAELAAEPVFKARAIG